LAALGIEIFRKKVVFLVLSGKNKFHHFWSPLGKIPSWSPPGKNPSDAQVCGYMQTELFIAIRDSSWVSNFAVVKE